MTNMGAHWEGVLGEHPSNKRRSESGSAVGYPTVVGVSRHLLVSDNSLHRRGNVLILSLRRHRLQRQPAGP